MKQNFIYFIVAMLFNMVSLPVWAQCNIIYVSPSVSSSSAAGTQTDPKSIASAFSSAPEGSVIRLAIGHYRGRMTEVARRLGIGRSTLYRKLADLGISDAA